MNITTDDTKGTKPTERLLPENVPVELNNTVSDEEYDELIDYSLDLGVKNAYIQEGETCLESFIPEFNKEGVH